MGLLPLVVDKLRQDSKLHDANMSKSTFGTKNVPAYSQFMFQYVYYCKQVYFQQEQSKLSGEIAFFSNLRKRGFQSGLKYGIRFHICKNTSLLLTPRSVHALTYAMPLLFVQGVWPMVFSHRTRNAASKWD